MLDYPGLSSREVVAARKRASSRAYPDCWPELIMDLVPSWVVLRSYEAETIRRGSPEVLSRFYSLARTFDKRAEVNAISSIAGRFYLLNDAYFEVYRRNPIYDRPDRGMVGLRPINSTHAKLNESWGRPAYDGALNLVSHAPSRLVFNQPSGARRITGHFGFFEGAYADSQNSIDGAEFIITYISAEEIRHELFRRKLDPRFNETDRGSQSFSLVFPTESDGSVELVITSGPHGQNGFAGPTGRHCFSAFRVPALPVARRLTVKKKSRSFRTATLR